MQYNQTILEAIPKQGSILDLGCVDDNQNYLSKKHLFKLIHKINQNVVGIDLNKEGISHLKSEGYDVYEQDVQKFNLNRKFDFILASNIIEHLNNLGGFLDSIKKHLKPQGVCVIITPNAYSIINFLGVLITGKRRINPGHTMWQSAETLEILLKRYNMKIKKIKYDTEICNNSFINIISTRTQKAVSWFRPAFSSTIHVEVKHDN